MERHTAKMSLSIMVQLKKGIKKLQKNTLIDMATHPCPLMRIFPGIADD
jgi:hypothetical protein